MPKLTINGTAVEVPAGTNLVEAAKAVGAEVPHYCYHPGLAIAGQCRLCMVDIEKNPKLQIGCNTLAADGMVVHTETDRVKETRRSVMEWHLVNHPLDCPVCDQAGECELQIYYMKHGLYAPRMVDEKVHKPKAVPLGPHVILDAERCILCSRCVRFCDEITGTGELGIFHRGDHSEIGLFPGKTLENNYSGNVIDICPVGALTDRDFRFQVRVWYLDVTRSICNGCARGCNIEIHTSQRRPHHNQGKRVARIKPRENPDVNRWWICDVGRYGFHWIDDDSRLTTPRRPGGAAPAETTWDDALTLLAEALDRYRPEEIGVLASPQMSNEDLWALRRFLDAAGIVHRDFRVPPRVRGVDDTLLLRADRNPNTRGAELAGLLPGPGGRDARAILAAAADRTIKLLWVLHHDLSRSAWPEAEVAAGLAGAELVVFQGTNTGATSAAAGIVVPSAAYAERDGTFTNFEGRVQRFRAAMPPLGDARPDWEVFVRLGRLRGFDEPVFRAERAEHVFTALADAVPAFRGLGYRILGDGGRPVST
ncbi:MAG: molybdopterin-dependent oxidoreductase [Candidatus Rokubacteria bacterium]|nr:molybdopterin-dependent oxidoreductase [Candidatus Rokubacteria bacterium]